MHDDDLPLSENLVRRLIAEHTPQWADLPCERLASSGTDNALYRLGDDLLLRLPRRGHAVDLIRKELNWLPHMQGLPLSVPNLRYHGTVDLGQPVDFGIFDWLDGELATPQRLADPFRAAEDMAAFLHALHLKDTTGAPRSGPANNRRGIALDELSSITLPAIDILADEIDSEAAHRLWKRACALPLPQKSVWLHGDLKADNLLERDGRIHAVLDWASPPSEIRPPTTPPPGSSSIPPLATTFARYSICRKRIGCGRKAGRFTAPSSHLVIIAAAATRPYAANAG